MKSVRYILPLGIFLAMCILFYFMLDRDTQLLPSPLVGKPLPEFSLPRLNANVTPNTKHNNAVSQNTDTPESLINHESYQGKKWLLNIWASWCAACRIEHPYFNEIASKTNWHLVGLNYKDQEDDAKRWLQIMHNPYKDIIFDIKGTLGFDLGVYGVPETFLIDEQGIIQYKHVGPICEAVITKIITPFFENKKMNTQISCTQ